MNESSSISRRDAWGVIRGFLYQVRSTVLQWIDLDRDTVLLCEWGEDIAHVRKGLDVSMGSDLDEYVFEQIKDRERHITLRSPEVLQALSNFWDHRRTASGSAIVRFRFTTTAVPGHEQDASFPGGLAGIDACQRLTANLADDSEVTQTLNAFRAIVKGPIPKSGSSEQAGRLLELLKFVASASEKELHEFLKGFDWAVGQPRVDVLRENIESMLVSAGFASPSGTQRACDRLTVHVLETLSQPGQKLLSRATLHETLAHLDLSGPEQALVDRYANLEEGLVKYLEEIGERVRRVEEIVSETRFPILETNENTSRILEILQSSIAPGRPVTQEVIPSLDGPPRPSRYHVHRKTTLQQLEATRHTATWIHFHATAGMGKTHLARDVCKEPPSRALVWISLSGFSNESEMVQHLDDQICVHLMQITGDNSWWAAHRAIGSSVTGMMETMVRGLGHGGLLVVDDVPDLVNNTRISARLQDLAMACSENDVPLLTTGQRKIPPQSSATLPPERMKQESVPPMSPSDVLEMLRVAGAPPAFLVPSLAELIEAPTHGHPSLISGVIVWLEQRSWVMDEKGLLDILTGAATADVQETAARRMVALIPHEAQKEMLCRLALIRRTFDRKAADVVASAAPPLARPGELLTELVGPWINRLDDDKFEVSPLVASAGYLYLARDEQQRIHAELADHILTQRTLSIDQAFPAIIHLLAAERWLQLGAVLVQALASAKTSAQAQQLGLLRLIFPPPSAWPSEMPLFMRIMIRAQQIRVARLASEDAEDLNRDLDSLLQVVSDKPDEAAALVYAQMHTGVLLRQTPTAERVRKAIQVVRMIRKYPELFSTMPEIGRGTRDYVWLAASDVKGVEDVDAIVEGLTSLQLDELKAAFQSDLSLEMCEIIADKCWADMSGRPEGEQDWNRVLATIAKLEDLARKASNEGLKVIALRARAITLADYMNRSEDALILLRSEPDPSDPDLLFMYRYTIARILDDKGDLEGAVSEYERAVAAGGEKFSYFRFSAHATAAEVSGRLAQWERATRLARAGISYAKTVNKAAKLTPQNSDVYDA